VYPKEYFSHPRILSFCHRTKIWRECDSLKSLSIRLNQLLTKEERIKFEHECSIFSKMKLPSMIDIYDPAYPLLLKEIYDPPITLSYVGDLSLLQIPSVAIVGTRKASKISILATGLLIEKLKENILPVCIVSGMALGIDRTAFEVAIGLGLGVIGVLGTSLEEEYPPGNRDLYRRLKSSKNTLLLSEFIFPTEPARWTFPKRNRLISGLVTDVYIMESGKKSGTLSTAMSALSQNREIHVFDHPLQFDNEGGKSLLGEGAEIIEWDLLSLNKGYIENPSFYGNEVMNEVKWQILSSKERNYKSSGKKTPLGRGAYWVRVI